MKPATDYRLLYDVFYLNIEQWKYIKFVSNISSASMRIAFSNEWNTIRVVMGFWQEMYNFCVFMFSILSGFDVVIMAQGAKLNEIYDTLIKICELKKKMANEMSLAEVRIHSIASLYEMYRSEWMFSLHYSELHSFPAGKSKIIRRFRKKTFSLNSMRLLMTFLRKLCKNFHIEPFIWIQLKAHQNGTISFLNIRRNCNFSSLGCVNELTQKQQRGVE